MLKVCYKYYDQCGLINQYTQNNQPTNDSEMEMKKTFKVKIFTFNKFTFFFVDMFFLFILLFLLEFVCECQKNVPKKLN